MATTNTPIPQHRKQPWPVDSPPNPHHHFFGGRLHPHYDTEPMFEKPLTPSDVGKLNRLVIPKHHAERYFPAGGGGGKGLLLTFEDEAGKPWAFRFSYWASSQSYVLTKGWSRYVKEKRLDAGDVVLFARLRSSGGGASRLLIGYRRRGAKKGGLMLDPNAAMLNGTVPRSSVDSAAAAAAAAAPVGSKRLRLFGVNLDCVPAIDHVDL